MPCEALSESLSAYFDHELPEAERSALADHLQQCPDCQATLKAYATLRQRLENEPLEEPSSNLVQRTLRRPSTWWRTFESVALSAAAGFVLLISSLLLFNISKPGLPDIPLTAQDHWGVQVTESRPAGKLINFECKGVLLV